MIGLAMAAVLGPILIMQPSKRQRHLAQLRAGAAAQGVKVHMVKLNKDTVAVYSKPWTLPEKVKKRILSWRLDKMTYVHEIHIAQYWQFTGEQPLDPNLKAKLPALLATLPEGVLAVEVTRSVVSCYWNERGGEQALQSIVEWLDAFTELMVSYVPPPPTD